MSDEEKSAKELDSLTKKSGDDNPPAEGKKPQKSSDELLSEYKAENTRKAEENSKLKSEKARLEAELAELREKEDEKGLSRKEDERVEDLEAEIKLAAKKLRQGKETLPWIEIAREEVGTAIVDYEIGKANEFVDDKAEELKMEPKELAKALTPFAKKYQELRPERRNQLAYRDWQKSEAKQKEIEAKEAKLKELEDKEQAFREGRGRNTRQPTRNDKFEEASKEDRLKMTVDLIG